jgi:hypothetical protein
MYIYIHGTYPLYCQKNILCDEHGIRLKGIKYNCNDNASNTAGKYLPIR